MIVPYKIINSQMQESNENKQAEKKNQKNIYVHKIKSLMRISQDSLIQDQKEINVALNKKNIKKTRSENAIKLEKNRESAKRARLRKKLYIKLLEKRVEKLNQAAEEGRQVENQLTKFSQMITKKEKKITKFDRDSDEIENYLEEQKFYESFRKENEKKQNLAKMDRLIEEVCQVSMCSSLRNIRQLSSQISFEQIIRAEEEKERNVQGEELKDIMKEVLIETEKLRGIYVDLANENESIKKSVKEINNAKDEDNYGDSMQEEKFLNTEDFSAAFDRGNEKQNIFINVTEGEKIMIEGWSYLEQKLNDETQL